MLPLNHLKPISGRSRNSMKLREQDFETLVVAGSLPGLLWTRGDVRILRDCRRLVG